MNFDSSFNGTDLPRIKVGAYVTNLEDKKLKKRIGVRYLLIKILLSPLMVFGTEYIPQEVLSKIKDKYITHNTYRAQNDDSIICGFYCIAFIEYN